MYKIKWLCKNPKGNRKLFELALKLTMKYQSMYVITPYITEEIVDDYIYSDNASVNLAEHLDRFVFLLAMMIGFTVLRSIIGYSKSICSEKASQELIYRLREKLFGNVQTQDADFFDKIRTGDLMTRLSGDLDMVRHAVANVITSMIGCIVLYLASCVFFFSIDWLMALCMIALTPIIFAISIAFKKVVGPKYVVLRDKLSTMNTGAEENISGNRVIKAFAREDYEIERFEKQNMDYSIANKDAALTWLSYFPFIEITAQSLSVVQLIAGGIFVINGRITVGEFTAFSGLIWTMSNPMRQLGNIINDLQRFMASVSKVIEVYYAHPLIITRSDAVETPERYSGDIVFDNVSFSYGNEEVLHNINLTIKAGQTVAIMGPTGSGKTTLINLIPRLYDVTKGAIKVEGVDVRMHDLQRLRSNIGLAAQDVLLFSDTIEGNICFGRSDMSEEDVHKYATLAAADSFIRHTSDGYDTIIGERGVGLSGGQKQRISLARALAVEPSILILDDTTSAVDMETEHYIQHSLANLDFNCTKIIIAQRISSTKNADMIVVIKDGKIEATGTHEELIKQDGYYKEVYDLQK